MSYLERDLDADLASVSPDNAREICLKILDSASQLLGLGIRVREPRDAWLVMGRIIELSNEYVLARFLAEALELDNMMDVNPLIKDMAVRDFLVCAEKTRMMVLEMARRGKSWIEIARELEGTVNKEERGS
ncbi:hypothetical protein GCM10007981_01770 [Thermocladium modestius]|uniref:Uncharacterized protein n=1 Tax=Thermocladium modestius TaxID=62609 RepID=A0A830GTM4_9CREN|nr:hypothetical protein [Thermocladium modestius]GGP19170.1 hypothetical protein GCM10007981_01770 [Thermocladium modestius]